MASGPNLKSSKSFFSLRPAGERVKLQNSEVAGPSFAGALDEAPVLTFYHFNKTQDLVNALDAVLSLYVPNLKSGSVVYDQARSKIISKKRALLRLKSKDLLDDTEEGHRVIDLHRLGIRSHPNPLRAFVFFDPTQALEDNFGNVFYKASSEILGLITIIYTIDKVLFWVKSLTPTSMYFKLIAAITQEEFISEKPPHFGKILSSNTFSLDIDSKYQPKSNFEGPVGSPSTASGLNAEYSEHQGSLMSPRIITTATSRVKKFIPDARVPLVTEPHLYNFKKELPENALDRWTLAERSFGREPTLEECEKKLEEFDQLYNVHQKELGRPPPAVTIEYGYIDHALNIRRNGNLVGPGGPGGHFKPQSIQHMKTERIEAELAAVDAEIEQEGSYTKEPKLKSRSTISLLQKNPFSRSRADLQMDNDEQFPSTRKLVLRKQPPSSSKSRINLATVVEEESPEQEDLPFLPSSKSKRQGIADFSSYDLSSLAGLAGSKSTSKLHIGAPSTVQQTASGAGLTSHKSIAKAIKDANKNWIRSDSSSSFAAGASSFLENMEYNPIYRHSFRDSTIPVLTAETPPALTAETTSSLDSMTQAPQLQGLPETSRSINEASSDNESDDTLYRAGSTNSAQGALEIEVQEESNQSTDLTPTNQSSATTSAPTRAPPTIPTGTTTITTIKRPSAAAALEALIGKFPPPEKRPTPDLTSSSPHSVYHNMSDRDYLAMTASVNLFPEPENEDAGTDAGTDSAKAKPKPNVTGSRYPVAPTSFSAQVHLTEKVIASLCIMKVLFTSCIDDLGLAMHPEINVLDITEVGLECGWFNVGPDDY